MRNLILILFLIFFSFSSNGKNFDKDLKIFGINFAQHNSIIKKLYFEITTYKYPASFVEVVRSMKIDHLVCYNHNIVVDWKTGECSTNGEAKYKNNLKSLGLPVKEKSKQEQIDEYYTFKKNKEFNQKWFLDTRIRPYVVSPPKKSIYFDFYVLWIDSNSKKIMALNASGPKSYDCDERQKKFWNNWNNSSIINDYFFDTSCQGGNLTLSIKHDKFEKIMHEEAIKLEQKN